jgi:uncharacterized protein YndB with AHSA1/START domain
MRHWIFIVSVLATALAGAAARAELVAAPAYGVQVTHKLDIAAPPAKVWEALGRIGEWWSPVHTLSHDAHNLRLSLEPGACFCELFPGGGGTSRMSVVIADPGKLLDLAGALGPPQAPGAPSGHLLFALAPSATGTSLTVSFEGGGFVADGAAQWGPPIDHVLGEQAVRLKRYVESGRPD